MIAFMREGDLVGELAAIDENLIRHELTAAEQALAIQRRTEIIQDLEAEKREVEGAINGNSLPKSRPHRATGEKRTGRPKGSVEPTSNPSLGSIQGVSKETVRKARKRAEALGTQTLERVKDTSLDAAGELDALAKLPEPEREELVTKAEDRAQKPADERNEVSAGWLWARKSGQRTRGIKPICEIRR